MELLEEQVFDDLCFIEALDESLTVEGRQQVGQSVRCDEGPPTVLPVPRLWDDVAALKHIFAVEVPAQLLLRPAHGAYAVIYGGGDRGLWILDLWEGY